MQRRARRDDRVLATPTRMWEPDALRELVKPFADPQVGYVCGQVDVHQRGRAPTRRACTGATRCGCARRSRRSRRSPAATARSTPSAARPTSRSTRSWATTSRSRSGWSRTAAARSTQPEARATEKMVPTIEGEWARKRRMMSHGWPIVVKGGLADPRGYPPLYALMIVSHRLLRYGTPFLHVLTALATLALLRPRRASTGSRRPPRPRCSPRRSPSGSARTPAARRPLLRADHGGARRRPVRLAAPRHAGRLGRAGGHAVNRYLHSRRKRALDLAVAGALLALSAPVVGARRARGPARVARAPDLPPAPRRPQGPRVRGLQAAHDGLRRRAHGRRDGRRRGRHADHARRRDPAAHVDRRAAEPGQRHQRRDVAGRPAADDPGPGRPVHRPPAAAARRQARA